LHEHFAQRLETVGYFTRRRRLSCEANKP
jgi:hypothetical protein